MAAASKLELLLLAKDKMSPAVERLLKLFKQAEKEGKSGAKAIDNLTKKIERAPKSDGLKKQNAELKKSTKETEKAAKAQEKLNNARKRKTPEGTTNKEVAAKAKLAKETEKAARAEEKLNNARRRRRSKSSSDSGSSFEEDLIAGGTGASMLWASKKGLTSAMTKQEAMTDLYSAFYRSSLSAAELNSQMLRGEKIADSLGNKLPGTTADYIQMFETMKQRGIETEVVLNGAGRAAAYLAVANKEDRTEVAENIARFGQMFNLRSEQEYMNAADLMSRAKTAYKISSSELMEAVKDFSGRTGKGLGLEGSKGAEDTLRYLSFLRAKTGLEGLTVGNAASSFFNQYLQAKQKKNDPTEELKKLSGVDLKIFDDKGKFLGLENAVKEFSKLKGKLTDEQQVTFGNQLAGEEGATVFQSMVKDGDQWAAFNKDLTESISLEEKSAKNAEILTNKIEALTGSLENLGAASFGPMLKPLGNATEGLNDFVGYLTEAAKARPTLAATTATVISLGGAFLALKGSSGIASRFFSGANSGILALGSNATATTGKLGGLRNSLLSTSGIFKVLLAVELAGATWQQIENLQNTFKQWQTANQGLDSAGQQQQKTYNYLSPTERKPKQEADSAMALLQQGNREFEKALDESRIGWYESFSRFTASLLTGVPAKPSVLAPDTSPKSPEEREKGFGELRNLIQKYRTQFTNLTEQGLIQTASQDLTASENLRKRVPVLQNPDVMTQFRQTGFSGMNDEMKQKAERWLQLAFPESFQQSTQALAANQTKLSEQSGQLSQAFSNMLTPTEALVTPMGTLNTNTTSATTSVANMTTAAQGFATRVNSLELKPPTFSPIQVPMYAPMSPTSSIMPTMPTGLGKAKGGSVRKGKAYPVGEIGKEWFVPQQSGSIVANDVIRNARNSVATSSPAVSLSVTINVDGAGNPKKAAMEIKRELTVLVRDLKAELTPRNMARKVSSEAERDYERM